MMNDGNGSVTVIDFNRVCKEICIHFEEGVKALLPGGFFLVFFFGGGRYMVLHIIWCLQPQQTKKLQNFGL